MPLFILILFALRHIGKWRYIPPIHSVISSSCRLMFTRTLCSGRYFIDWIPFSFLLLPDEWYVRPEHARHMTSFRFLSFAPLYFSILRSYLLLACVHTHTPYPLHFLMYVMFGGRKWSIYYIICGERTCMLYACSSDTLMRHMTAWHGLGA